MKTIKQILICISMLSLLFSCSNEFMNRPIEKNDKVPGKIVVTNIENTPGGAVITYALPNDQDLLYVLAMYTEKGNHREFKASYYTNKIEITGLSREEDYEIELITVNRSEKRSESVRVTVHPLTPPVMGVLQTMMGSATFGGITFTYDNPSKAFVAIGILTQNEEGEFYEHDTYYSSQPSPKFSVRGFDSVEREFKVYVKDKWGNFSDTISFTVLPIGEMELNKSLFKEMKLRGDADPTAWGGQMRYIWDGRALGDNEGQWGLHTGNNATGVPMIITFDLGVEATLSRFKLWPIMDDKHMYNDVTPRNYEIWGRLETVGVNDDGELFPHWFKMGEIENVKPSGLPIGSLSDDDRAAARAGDEYVFEYNMFTTRYIRIRCAKNWIGNTNMCFSEVSFWATTIN